MRLASLLLSGATANALYRNVVYFGEWSPQLSNFHVMDIDASRITHVNYAFGIPNADGSITFENSTAAFTRVYGADLGPSAVQGNFGQLNAFKRLHPNVKVGLAIGGWGNSDAFGPIAASTSLRTEFVQNVVTLITDLGLDGIDIDWEYPTGSSVNDFYSLLQDLKSALNQLPFKTELSFAAQASTNDLGPILSKICAVVDTVNLMTYDLEGSWSRATGHQSNLYTDPNAPGDFKSSTDVAAQYYISSGCPSSKLIMGMPLYGTSFENTNGIYQKFTKPTQGSYEANGNWIYKSLPLPGMTEQFDSATQATFGYNPTTRMFMSYDGPASTQAKANYIQQKALGGSMFWEVAGDAPAGSNRSLITTVVNTLGSGNLNTAPSNLKYPTSIYSNIRSGLAPTLQLYTSRGMTISEFNGNLYANTPRHNLNEQFEYDAITNLIRSVSGNSCLDAYPESSKASGYSIHTWQCSASNDNQKWKVDAQNHRLVHLVHSNLCVDVDPNDSSHRVQVWQCHSLNTFNPNQWIGLPEEHIKLLNNQLAFTGYSSGAVGFSPVNSPGQTWTFDNVHHTVEWGTTRMCLDAYQGWNGGAVHLWACTPSNKNQQWQYDSSTRQLRHLAYTGYCLDMGSSNGALPHLWECHTSTDFYVPLQQFSYQSVDYSFMN
ncbi:hypothetical protein THRCLA_02391 [Thraustotheca clavata]|uniref:GH18 domain-containing protein n=1 Tax=Thraustotheca clavata TaxID=74557 RepID=A0A1W0A5J2_9STRA|nr:hypothetical protein THRCLA_02391 [Thraustotheca clavata]